MFANLGRSGDGFDTTPSNYCKYISFFNLAEAISVAGALRGLNSAVEYGDAIGVMSYLANNWELFGLQAR
jgi:hypothetical protein